MFYVLMRILYLLLFTINIFTMELNFSMPVTITYNNNAPEKDRFILNSEEKSYLTSKIASWKRVAEYCKEPLPDPIKQIFISMPPIDVLLGDSDILNYKKIIEAAYAFSPNKIENSSSKSSIVSEEIFRQKLLYLEVLLYNNTVLLPIENKTSMINRFNMLPEKTHCECPRIKDFLFRHQDCSFYKAKILATIFLLYLF